MLWRQLFSKKNDHPTDHIEQAYSAPLGFALESRVLFDGAIAATATQAETNNASDATASSHPAQTANHSAEATSENNTSSDQNSATHDITTDVVVQAVVGETTRKEAVFIDTALTDYQTLVNSVPAGVDVFLLDSSKDGLTQMAIWAETHTGYDAIHILSHGNEGQVRLGNLTLDSVTAEARSADLAKLGTALTQDGDLLLYGCDIAQDTGKSFVSLLSQLTQADIAASDDLTGAASKGGNWQLETTVGNIETTGAALGTIAQEYNSLLASPTHGTNTFSQFSGTTSFVNVQPGLQTYNDLNNGFTYVANSTGDVTIQTTAVSGNQVLNTIVTPGGNLNYFALKSTDGSEFKLSSIDLRGLGNYVSTFTITGYKDGSAVAGATQTITLTLPFQTVTFSNAFQDIDEVRLTTAATGNGTVTWDNIVTASLAAPTDNVPSIAGSATNPTYTENGADVGLFTNVIANTNDSGQTFTGATLTITNVADSTEYLNINGVKVSLINGNSVSLGSGYGSASVSLSAGTAIVSLSGATLSNADMGTLLSGMTYGNSSENPHTTARVVTLTQVTDSGTSNNSYSPGNIASTVTVVAVNDAPTDLALSNTTFGQSLGSNGLIGTLSATDVDSTTFTYSLVSGVGSTDNALFILSGNTLRAVNAATMAAGTYSVRLQVSDGQATYEKVVTLTVTDDIAPTFDATPTITAPTVSGFTLNTDLNERGTIYYVVLPDGASAPSVTQVINGQNASGSLALTFGSQLAGSAPYSQSLTLTGLAAATAYDVYVVARDSAGNATVSVVKLDVTTAASSTAPTLSATGNNPVFIGGMAGAVDLFSGVSADTRDSGQTFNALTLTVSNVSDSGEFISVAGNTISLASNSSGTLTGIGSYTVTRVGNTVTLQLSGMTASNTQFAGLVDGLRYGNSNNSVTEAMRNVSLTAVSDSGTSNNTTSLNLTSSVNVLASNSALYVTSGEDTGDDASFGNSLQDDLNDGGGLSLREALHWANVTPGIDRIVLQTNVTLADNILVPTSTLLLDGQSFILNGGGYSGFQITSASFTFAIQNLTLTNFTTTNNTDTGGVLGLTYSASDVNLRLYNVDITGNSDNMLLGNGMIDLSNINPGTYVIDLDRVNIYKNTLAGGYDSEGVIKLFVSAQQALSLSLTNSAIYNNSSFSPPNGAVGVAGLYLTSSGNTNAPNTHITLMNTTITGQDAGIVFDFTNAASNWVASVRNSIISGNTVDMVIHNDTTTNGSYTLNGGNNLIGSSVDLVSSSDPRLAATASNAINQGDRFYVTGNGDARGLDRVRQGAVDIGAYESQFASGVSPQVDLNGAGAGSDYSATVSSGLSAGVPITDMLATLSQTDGDTRLWTLTLALAGSTDGASEYLTLSQQALLAAHAAGINVSGDGSQTLTLTGGAASEAFQTALRAIVYVNVATTPSGGARTISVTANDDASRSATSTLTVVVGNPPVVATPIPAQSVVQDGNLSFTVPAGTFTDPDIGDTLTLSATLTNGLPLPGWLSFNAATGTFSGTPGNADVGNLSIRITATDGSNASVYTDFSLTVTNVNDAPVVTTPIPAQSVAQGGSLSFTVPAGTFTDPDVGDTLTLSATLADGSPLPSWITFNAATGTFSGTPGNADVGSLSIRITATDGSNASVYTDFSLTITNVNDAPVVATPIPAQSVAQNGSLSFTVPSGTFTDPDIGDTLTLSATLTNGLPLPGWLSFNAATGTFSGTPGNADVGNLSIRITATDGSNASVYTDFSLTITNVNDTPVVTTPIPAQSVAQGGSLNFTVPAGTFTDPDVGDTLTLSATLANGSPLPSWITFNAATGTFSGTPGNADVGSLSIRVTATDDSNASVYTDFSLTVTNVNDAPVVATPIPPQSVAQDGSLNFTVPAGTFTDPDVGDTLTLSATLADGSPLPGWITFNPATGTFSGTPGNNDIGNLSIKVTANDGDASISTTFSLTVTPLNQAPVVSTPIPPQSVVQDGGFNFTVPAGTFSDPDGDTLTLSATLANGSPLPSWLHFDPTIGTFSGTPGNADVGTLVIRVTATDGSNTSVSTSFGLTVTNVNDAPVVATPIPPQSVAQDGGFNFTVPAGTFSDPDGDALTLSATLANGSPLPSWLHFDPTIGTFSGTPGNADVGTLVIRVTATDGSNTSVSTSFGLTVTNVNDAPVVATPIPPQSVAQDGGFNFTVPAGTFSDPDGDTLTLSATLADGSPLPSWLRFDPTIGTFSGTPGNADVGTLVIRVTATDGSNTSVSTSFGLTVTNVNDAPVVATPIPPQSVAQDGGFNFTVPAGTFSDPDGDSLTLSATLADGSPLPSWLHFDPTIGTFSGTPGNADVGTLVIRVTATDGSNTSVSTSFGLTVTNVNDAPVVATPIPPQSVAQDGGFNFTVPAGTFSDPDGDTLTLSATLADGSPLPSWLRFDPTIGTFSGTPGNADVGTLVIRVTATDGSNTSISTSFGLTVTRSLVSGDPQFKANDGIGRTPSASDTRQLSAQDAITAPPTLGGLIANPSLGNLTVGNNGAPMSVMSAIFATGRQNTEGGTLPASQVAGAFGHGVASGIGVNFDSSLGSFPSFSKDPALGGTSSLASAFSGIYLPSLTPMEVFSGGSWKDIPLDRASNTVNSADGGTGRSVAFTPSLHQQLQQIGDSELQRLAAIEQALQESSQQQG